MAEIVAVAISEDAPVVWIPREGVSRRSARRAGAAEMCAEKARRFRVRKRYMRPARQEDCPAWPHGQDESGEPDGCRCFDVEEGWHMECEPAEPAAIPVWRVEERSRLRDWFWEQVRRHVYRQAGLLERRPVLWGGRVDRTATWLDHLLIGTPRGYTLHRSDHWLTPGESELRWCHSCRATTPHDPPTRYGRGWCLAEGHGESKAAPMATDLRPATPQQKGAGR